MIVGTVREIKTEEYRVALTPEGVGGIVQAGHDVVIESDAGTGSSYNDDEYREAGATVLKTAAAVYERAELICKVKEPQPREFELLRERQILFTYLHLAAEPAQRDRGGGATQTEEQSEQEKHTRRLDRDAPGRAARAGRREDDDRASHKARVASRGCSLA